MLNGFQDQSLKVKYQTDSEDSLYNKSVDLTKILRLEIQNSNKISYLAPKRT